MMKYVFVLVLLVVGAAAGLMGMNVGLRWIDNMTATPKVLPGERAFSMPVGSVPRNGGELRYSVGEREAAAQRKNPVPATPESVPPADLTNADLQKGRTDGYWQSYLSVGGSVMPSYEEALSPEERWHVVNYVRTLAQQR
jgi:hypothetical protein